MRALITGITGQDGSYLVELLLLKGYQVIGIMRRSSSLNNLDRLTPEVRQNPSLKIVYGDVTDAACMAKIICKWCDENFESTERLEIYNLAAQSHVQVSFEMSQYTNHTNVLGVYNILNAVINLPQKMQKKIRFYQASSSEMFGLVQQVPQTEKTPFYPRSPYAVSKLAGYWATVNTRESYGIYACNGILFNHESPRRGENFVTRKITRQIAEIAVGKRDSLTLGNLNAKRDWGHAKDYVVAMWLMLQRDIADDFVIATGKQYSVRQFVEIAFRAGLNIEINWKGAGVDEVGYDASDPDRILVRVSADYCRPAEVETLLGNANKAKDILNWVPSITVEELATEMVLHDLAAVNK